MADGDWDDAPSVHGAKVERFLHDIATHTFDLREEARETNALLRKLLAQKAAPAAAPQSGGVTTGAIASDNDLNSERGDPVVRVVPRDWQGADYKGVHLSQTEPAFLEMLAGMLDHFASNPKAGKEQYAKNDARDAARARGWARRLGNGFKPEPRVEPDAEDFIP